MLVKKLLSTLIIFFPLLSNAQWTTSGATTSTTNAVGIGTSTPAGKLDVNGSLALSGNIVNEVKQLPITTDGTIVVASGTRIRGTYTLSFEGASRAQMVVLSLNASQFDYNSALSILSNTSFGGQQVMSNFRLAFNSDNTVVFLLFDIGNRSGGNVVFANFSGTGLFGPNWGGVLPASTSFQGGMNPIGVSGGNVGIGTLNPGNYRLAVNGSIHAKQVNVDLNSWADYVFNKDYKLPSLEDLEVYIKKNQHLPNIPSEEDVIKNGIDLGEMNKQLLHKIEELTLYFIEKNNELKAEKVLVKSIELRIRALERNKN